MSFVFLPDSHKHQGKLSRGEFRISLGWRRQHTILPKISQKLREIDPKNYVKLKEFGPPVGGGGPKFYYLDPPLVSF